MVVISESTNEPRLDSWGRKIHTGGFVKEFVKADINPSKELSYVLGALKGDGTTYTNPDNWYYRVQLSVTDKCFAEKFKKCLEEIGLNPCLYSQERKNPNHKKLSTVAAISRHFVEWYKEKDLEELSEIVWDFKEDFIMGMYDSEGSLDIRERKRRNFPQIRILIVNTDKKLLKIVKSILDNMGIFSRLVTGFSTSGREGDKTLWGIRIYSCPDAIDFLKRIDSSIERKSYSRLKSKIGDREPKEVGIYTKETYEKAMKMRKEHGWGSPKISQKLEIPQATVGGWIYKGKAPYSAKKGGNIA